MDVLSVTLTIRTVYDARFSSSPDRLADAQRRRVETALVGRTVVVDAVSTTPVHKPTWHRKDAWLARMPVKV